MWSYYAVATVFSTYVSVSCDENFKTTEEGWGRPYRALCTAYCDGSGYLRPASLCTDYAKRVYCCGDLHQRYCCNQLAEALLNQPPDVTSCSKDNHWWTTKYGNWQAVIGLLGAIVSLLVMTAAFYYCCLFLLTKNAQFRRGTSRSLVHHGRCHSISSIYDPNNRNQSFCFDPSSPTAFQPPSYSLSKEGPPSYRELMPNAFCNMSLLLDETRSLKSTNTLQSPLPTHDILPYIGDAPPPYVFPMDETSRQVSQIPQILLRRHTCATIIPLEGQPLERGWSVDWGQPVIRRHSCGTD